MSDTVDPKVYEMIGLLASMSDSAIDQRITARLRRLIGQPKEVLREKLVYLLHMCVDFGMSNGFAVIALRLILEHDLQCKVDEMTLPEWDKWPDYVDPEPIQAGKGGGG